MALSKRSDPQTVDICAHGDAILNCGSSYGDGKSVRLRVNASVLRLASSVFAELFNLQIKTEPDLLGEAFEAPAEFDLSDDDPMAMEVICNIMHLQNEKTNHANYWLPPNMLRIARAGDKYQCAVALRPTMRLRLNNRSHSSRTDLGTIRQVFAAAYLLRDVVAFRKFGRELLLYSTKSIWDISVGREQDGVGKILILLEARMWELKRKVISFIETQIFKRSQLRFSKQGQIYSCERSCTWAEAMTVAHMDQLNYKSLYPSTKICHQNLDDLIAGLRSIMYQDRDNFLECYGDRCIAESQYDGPRPKVVDEYREFADEMAREVVGPCLDCYMAEEKVDGKACEHPKAALFTLDEKQSDGVQVKREV